MMVHRCMPLGLSSCAQVEERVTYIESLDQLKQELKRPDNRDKLVVIEVGGAGLDECEGRCAASGRACAAGCAWSVREKDWVEGERGECGWAPHLQSQVLCHTGHAHTHTAPTRTHHLTHHSSPAPQPPPPPLSLTPL